MPRICWNCGGDNTGAVFKGHMPDEALHGGCGCRDCGVTWGEYAYEYDIGAVWFGGDLPIIRVVLPNSIVSKHGMARLAAHVKNKSSVVLDWRYVGCMDSDVLHDFVNSLHSVTHENVPNWVMRVLKGKPDE